MSITDKMGERMKEYEACTRYFIPRRSYTIIRVDGRAFHTYTKKLQKPFDKDFTDAMDYTAKELCREIMGARFAFVQSDEVSILVTDFGKTTTEAWFGNNIQKMCSVSASIATASFLHHRVAYAEDARIAHFDSRVYQIPQRTEVLNYFRWRQRDTIRNSIESTAHAHFPQKEMQNKNGMELRKMLEEKGVKWEDLDAGVRSGRLVLPVENLEGRKFWSAEPAVDFFAGQETDAMELMKVLIPENEIMENQE